MSKASLNRRMVDWWEERLASGDVDIKREADRGVEEFLGDAEFCREFLGFYVRDILYQAGIDMASRRRRLIREEGKAIARSLPVPATVATRPPSLPPPRREERPIPTAAPVRPPTPPPPVPFAKEMAQTTPVLNAAVTRSWEEWLERDPDTGHHVALDFFTKPKLLKASRKNRDRGGQYLYNAALYALFAGRLPDDHSALGDVLTDHDKNAIAGNLQVRLRAEFGLRGIPGQATWEDLLT